MQTQCVVMCQQRLDGSLNPVAIQHFACFEQNRLIEVMRIDELLREEPLLDRGERRGSPDGTLDSVYRRRSTDHRRKLGNRLLFEELSRAQKQPCLVRTRDDLDAE